MIKVYRAINVTKGEVYHGTTSKSLELRKREGHCRKNTKSIRHWDCERDKIIWKEISNHRTHSNASKKAHDLEKKYRHHKGFRNINTRGV